MPNTIITPTWVAKDTAISWKNSIKLVSQFDRRWDAEYSKKPGGAKIGYVVQARIPQRFVVNEGQQLQIQPITNQTVPITLNHQFQVATEWSTADATVSIEETQERYTIPAGRALGNKVDVVAGQEVYKSVYWSAGTPGTAITDDATYTDAVAKLRNVAVSDDLCVVMDPKSQSKLLAANFALFNPQSQISKYFRSGQFSGAALGVDDWYWDANVPTHTTGTFTASTPVVSSASQTGSTLALSGLGTYAFKNGDVFTVAGVDAVNPVSYVDTGDLQQFVVVGDTSGSSTVTLTISPPIITSGPLQTVTASPANNAAVTFVGATGTVSATMAAQTSRQTLLFNPGAFAFVMADLTDALDGAVAKTINDADSRLSLRYVSQYAVTTDQMPRRFDMLVGVAPVQPSFAMRLWS